MNNHLYIEIVSLAILCLTMMILIILMLFAIRKCLKKIELNRQLAKRKEKILQQVLDHINKQPSVKTINYDFEIENDKLHGQLSVNNPFTNIE